MPNYDITPEGSSTPKIRLYDNALTKVPRSQENAAESPTMAQSAPPKSEPDGLAAAGVRFRGVWLGTDASALAERLRTMLNDESVGKVDVQAVDGTGNGTQSPYNGTYTLDGESRVEQTTPATDSAWEYDIRLTET